MVPIVFRQSYNLLRCLSQFSKGIKWLSLVLRTSTFHQNFLRINLERCRRCSYLLLIYDLFFLLIKSLYILIFWILMISLGACLITFLVILHSFSYQGLEVLLIFLIQRLIREFSNGGGKGSSKMVIDLIDVVIISQGA